MLSYIKKMLILIAVSLAVLFSGPSKLYAQDGNEYLRLIAEYTNGILQQVNNLPNYLEGLGKFIISWMAEDKSDSTASMQQLFATIGQSFTTGFQDQLNLQPQLLADLFSPPPPAPAIKVADLTAPANVANSILNKLPNVNELSYPTMLGQPPSPKAPGVANAPYGYVKKCKWCDYFPHHAWIKLARAVSRSTTLCNHLQYHYGG